MSIFDVNLWLGRWPFRPSPREELPALKAHLHRHGIEGGLVRAAEAAFTDDPAEENRRLFARLAGETAFLPAPVAHPCFPETWRTLPAGVRAAALYPQFQDFALDAPETLAMARALLDQGAIPLVVVREEDERIQHKHCLVPGVAPEALDAFADALAPAPVVALGAMIGEARRLAAPNLLVDISFTEAPPSLPPLVADLGAERLLFGSHTPFHCTGAAVAKCDALSPEDRALVTRDNAKRVLRLGLF